FSAPGNLTFSKPIRACADGVSTLPASPSAARAGAQSDAALATMHVASHRPASAAGARDALTRVRRESSGVGVEPVDGGVGERAHAERQPGLVDEEERRVVGRRRLRILRWRRDADEEEESGNDMLVEGEILRARDLGHADDVVRAGDAL